MRLANKDACSSFSDVTITRITGSVPALSNNTYPLLGI